MARQEQIAGYIGKAQDHHVGVYEQMIVLNLAVTQGQVLLFNDGMIQVVLWAVHLKLLVPQVLSTYYPRIP